MSKGNSNLPKWPRASLDQIDHLIAECEPGKAIALAREAGKKWPDDVRFALRIVAAYRSMRRLHEAAETLDQILESDPMMLSALRQRAGIANAMSDFATADTLVARAVMVEPDAPIVAYAQIETLIARGDVFPALDLAKATAEKYPDEAQPHQFMASLYAEIGRFRSAAQSCRDVLKRDPDNINATIALGTNAAHLRDLETSRAMAEKAIQIDPYNMNARLGLAHLSRAEGASKEELELIVDELEADLKNASDRSEKWRALQLGDMAVTLGQFAKALSYWSELGTDDEPDTRRWLAAADLLLRFGRTNDAKTLVERYLEYVPGHPQARQRLAGIETSLGNVERGIQMRYDLIADEFPRQIRIAIRLSMDLHLMGRHEEASALFEHWREIGLRFPDTEISTVLQRQSRIEEVIEYARHWMDIDDCPVYHRRYQIFSLTDLKRFDEARTVAERWRTQDPTSAKDFLEYIRADEASGGRRDPGDNIGTPDHENVATPEKLALVFDQDGPVPFAHWPAMRLAWSVARDKSMGFEAWRDAVLKATDAHRVLSRTPALIEDLLEYIEEPDLSPLRDLLDEDKPFICVTSHSGPYAGYAASHFIPKSIYMMTGRHRGVTQVPVISFLGDNNRAAVQAVTSLRRGYRMFITSDTAADQMVFGPANAVGNGKLFGIPMQIPNTTAKLSQEMKIPTFMFQPYWRDGRIVFDIQRLPDAQPGEARQDWYDRWTSAYLAHVEAVMSSAPENQNLSAAPWRYLLLRGLLDPKDAVQPQMEPA